MTAASFFDLWGQFHDTIEKTSLRFDRKWRQRNHGTASISTQFLIAFIFKLVLSKNKQGYGTTLAEFWAACKQARVKVPKREPFAASSVCEARNKMDPGVFVDVNSTLIKLYEERLDSDKDSGFRWHDKRLFVVDGSKLNLPADLSRQGWLLANDKIHYPQGLLTCLYQLGSGIVYDFALTKSFDERLAAKAHLSKLTEDDVVIYDRGYFGYEFLLQHHEQSRHAIFRLRTGGKQMKAIADFINHPELGDDVIVTIEPDIEARKKLRQKYPNILFKAIPLRLVRYEIDGVTHLVATTLLDEKFSKDDFREIYHGRWGVEELYKTYKVHIDVEDFHSKSERGVLQEVYAAFVLANMGRILTNQAQWSLEQELEPSTSDSIGDPKALDNDGVRSPKKSLLYPKEQAFLGGSKRSIIKLALSS